MLSSVDGGKTIGHVDQRRTPASQMCRSKKRAKATLHSCRHTHPGVSEFSQCLASTCAPHSSQAPPALAAACVVAALNKGAREEESCEPETLLACKRVHESIAGANMASTCLSADILLCLKDERHKDTKPSTKPANTHPLRQTPLQVSPPWRAQDPVVVQCSRVLPSSRTQL